MKYFYILLVALLTSSLSFGQLSEGFEFIPGGGWINGTVSLSSGDWEFAETRRDNTARTGSGAAKLRDRQDASITTPALTGAATVSFWYSNDNNRSGTFSLETSTDGTNYTEITTQGFGAQTSFPSCSMQPYSQC